MFTVTIGTYGRIGFAPHGQFAVDPFPVIAFDSAVAFAAGVWNIEMIDGRIRIPGREYPMRGSSRRMAIITCCRYIYSPKRCLAVNAILISFNWLLEINVVLLDQIQVFVASAASLRKIGRMNMRLLI